MDPTICKLKKYRIMSDIFRNKLRKYNRVSDSIRAGKLQIMNIIIIKIQ